MVKKILLLKIVFLINLIYLYFNLAYYAHMTFNFNLYFCLKKISIFLRCLLQYSELVNPILSFIKEKILIKFLITTSLKYIKIIKKLIKNKIN